jgi:hypothetical protein
LIAEARDGVSLRSNITYGSQAEIQTDPLPTKQVGGVSLNKAGESFFLASSPYSLHNASMTKSKVEFRRLFWYVQVVLHDVPPLQLGGFKTEEEAQDWITRKSDAWLKAYANGRYA